MSQEPLSEQPIDSLPASPVPVLTHGQGIARGGLYGLAALFGVIATYWLLTAVLPREHWGASAAAGFANTKEPWLFLSAVLLVPALETVIAQLLPIEILRRLGAPAWVCVAGSAALFSLGHGLNGGLAHAATTAVSGLVMATAYLSARPASAGHAFGCAWSAHATKNGLLLYFVGPLFPTWE
jgi:hypothetical protein